MSLKQWLARKIDQSKHVHLQSSQILVTGFFVIILVGSLLLSLPVSHAPGVRVNYLDALFTATTSVCVTGLVVVDTGMDYSLFGQVVVLLLIQLGGLGFMTFTSIAFSLLGKRLTLRERATMREALGEQGFSKLSSMALWAIRMALACEAAGALIMATRFVPALGWGKGVWASIFHSVSAFCNAGLDVLGNYQSMTAYAGDPVVSLTICALIIMGGLGFIVVNDVVRSRRFSRCVLNTKLVLVTTGALLVGGTLVLLAAEWSNPKTLGALPPYARPIAALFQSTTARTAGFNSIDQAGMRDFSKLITMLLMFIGASPASTGGGVKTTTLAMFFLALYSVSRGRAQIVAYGRAISRNNVMRAVAITMLAIVAVLLCTLLLTVTESGKDVSLTEMVFEVISGLSTTGLSMGITTRLSAIGRVALIVMMYMGRVGPLTLALALGRHEGDGGGSAVVYPKQWVNIG